MAINELPEFASGSRLLSMSQIMVLLNCRSRKTISRMIGRGILKPIKLGPHKQSPVKFRYDETIWSLDNYRKA